MRVSPTPVTAALAGIFSGLTWPVVWPLVARGDTSATLWLVLATIALVAMPAHAFVLGFQRREAAAAGGVDVALLTRIASWLAGGVLAALLGAAVRGAT
ncbi:MAG TPA: hypothetical protein VLD35_01165 [Caldimonas sp.]|nr:hypothetical protein [Caldimonas sp.]